MIPRKIQLAGINIDVVIDRTLYKDRKIVAEAQYPPQRIVIDPSIQTNDSVEQNYYHELVHWILYIMSEDELRQNEKFVDMFGHLLYQAEKSGCNQEHYCTDDLKDSHATRQESN